MYKFPSIGLYKNIIKIVNDRTRYDGHVVKPIIKFTGTVKLHGTNSAVEIVTNEDGSTTLIPQSRRQVITVEEDNNGFAKWCLGKEETFGRARWSLGYKLCVNFDKVVVFGEWCGGNIQPKVALNKLPKMFVVFAVGYVARGGNADELTWFTPDEMKATRDVWNEIGSSIYSYPTYEIKINFENPQGSQNELVDLALAVENECPVAAAHGVKGLGEGIVWIPHNHPSFYTEGLTFKVKGEKHSDTKVRTTAPIDEERLNSIRELADFLVTEHRLEKGVDFIKLVKPNEEIKVDHIPIFLKWLSEDISKENIDTITENGFERKEVIKAACTLARSWFLKKYFQKDIA